jgi:hypothetical protein
MNTRTLQIVALCAAVVVWVVLGLWLGSPVPAAITGAVTDHPNTHP